MSTFYVGKQNIEFCLSCELKSCEPTSVLCPLYNDRDESMETRLLIIALIKEKMEDKRTRESIRCEIDRVKRMGAETTNSFNKLKARSEVRRLKLLEENYTRRIKNLSAMKIAQKMEVPLTLVTGMEKTRARL